MTNVQCGLFLQRTKKQKLQASGFACVQYQKTLLN